MSKIGYLRVSTDEQAFDRQLHALRPCCDALYVETLSAVSKRRPMYARATKRLRRGDTFVVLDTDRAYRDSREALNEIHRLEQRGVAFKVLNFWMDTTTPEGRFALEVKLAADGLERRTLSRRTKEGMAAARRRGKILGRPRKLSDEQVIDCRRRLTAKSVTLADLAREHTVVPCTLRRALSRWPTET